MIKVYWLMYSDGEPVEYLPTDHAYEVHKFLYWDKEKVIIAGPSRLAEHSILLRAGRSAGVCPDRDPDGAGMAIMGEVHSWESLALGITTPEDLRGWILVTMGLEYPSR